MGGILQLQLSKTSLIQLNSCRIYLQVFHLSDIFRLQLKKIVQKLKLLKFYLTKINYL